MSKTVPNIDKACPIIKSIKFRFNAFVFIPYPLKFFLYYKKKSLTTVVRLSKSLYRLYMIISNISAISSVAIVTFDFSIRMFPPVIM